MTSPTRSSAKGVAAQFNLIHSPTAMGDVEQRGELRVSNRWEARSPATE
jgi:hypothetical protein